MDNSEEHKTVIIGSYDPNDKTPLPNFDYEQGEYALGQKEIEYTIRFQNTGTANTKFVVLLDTIDEEVFDLFSFKMISASHPYQLDNSNNLIKWRFNPLSLVPADSSWILSQGFLKFSLSIKDPLSVGNIAYNKAGIYFDFNPPIITNNSEFEVLETPLISSRYDPDNTSFTIFPNPTSQIVHIESKTELKNLGFVQLVMLVYFLKRITKLRIRYKTSIGKG